MLNKIVDLSLRHRLLVLIVAGLLSLMGVVALWQLPFDAFPDTTPVMVQINVSAPGWAPEDLELLASYPIEQAVTGLSQLSEVRSISKYGFCQVTAIFAEGTDLYLARQQVSEKLAVTEMPEGIGVPQLGPVSTGLGEIFHYIVVADSGHETDPRTAQDWIVKPQLQSVTGVAEVNSWGGFVKQYTVLFDPDRVAQYDLSIEDVAEAIKEGLGNVPGGQIVRGGEMTIIRGIGVVENVRQVESIVVATRNTVPILVSDIGEVVISHETRLGASTYNGKGEAVLGLGFMIMDENPARVAKSLAERLVEAEKSLPPGVHARPVYKRTDLVDKVLETVKHNLFIGAALVIAILFIFLGNLRAGLIVASAIPLSMLFAFDLMSRVGIIGSLMSLGAIDFGLAVDNAVIQVENSVRRLSHGGAEDRLTIIRDAILEVRKPTLFGELIIIIVYLPILTLQGIEGQLFRPMALTVVFVLTGSLLLSFTVIPALIGVFMRKGVQEKEPALMAWLRRAYTPILELALRSRRKVIGGAIAITVAGVALFMTLGSEFVPRMNEGTIVINFVRLAGISLQQSVEYNTRIEKLLLTTFSDEIDHVWTRVGTAELSTDPMGLELSDMFVSLTPQENWTKVESQTDLVAAVDSVLDEMIAGIRSDVGIKIFGDDFTVLEAKAEEIATVVGEIDGAQDVTVEQITGQPQLRLSLDRQRLARFGFTAEDVLTAIHSLGGIEVGHVNEDQRRFDLILRADSTRIRGPEDVSQIFLRSPTGGLVGLDRLTTAVLDEGPGTITREWSKRRVIVQCNVRGRDVGSFVADLKDKLKTTINLPSGYFVRLGGQFENYERARTRLFLVVPLALLLIFGLLYFSYGSARDAGLIFTCVPLAAFGGVTALALRGMPFSISAGVGFTALFGIAVLNGLVLVSNIKRLRSEGVELQTAVKESALNRLRPVLMTALVAAFGFIPMAFSASIGSEVQRPLATVVIGGVITSTLLTLVVLPVLYATFGRKTASEV
jgi:heavy metal efflux system protein